MAEGRAPPPGAHCPHRHRPSATVRHGRDHRAPPGTGRGSPRRPRAHPGQAASSPTSRPTAHVRSCRRSLRAVLVDEPPLERWRFPQPVALSSHPRRRQGRFPDIGLRAPGARLQPPRPGRGSSWRAPAAAGWLFEHVGPLAPRGLPRTVTRRSRPLGPLRRHRAATDYLCRPRGDDALPAAPPLTGALERIEGDDDVTSASPDLAARFPPRSARTRWRRSPRPGGPGPRAVPVRPALLPPSVYTHARVDFPRAARATLDLGEREVAYAVRSATRRGGEVSATTRGRRGDPRRPHEAVVHLVDGAAAGASRGVDASTGSSTSSSGSAPGLPAAAGGTHRTAAAPRGPGAAPGIAWPSRSVGTILDAVTGASLSPGAPALPQPEGDRGLIDALGSTSTRCALRWAQRLWGAPSGDRGPSDATPTPPRGQPATALIRSATGGHGTPDARPRPGPGRHATRSCATRTAGELVARASTIGATSSAPAMPGHRLSGLPCDSVTGGPGPPSSPRGAAVGRDGGGPAYMDRRFIRDVTNKMCDRDFDWTRGVDVADDSSITATDDHGQADLARGREYREQFAGITARSSTSFAVDDRVVVAYTLDLHRRDGTAERMAVMAIWTVADGKVTALREVDAPRGIASTPEVPAPPGGVPQASSAAPSTSAPTRTTSALSHSHSSTTTIVASAPRSCRSWRSSPCTRRTGPTRPASPPSRPPPPW